VRQEKQDYLEVVREVWGMQLDATRNRIIRIDLVVAIASFALIMPTVPAAFFGMNLRSGVEVRTNCWPHLTIYCPVLCLQCII
jgi:Mg2+ and Co2+ transporter CorA